MHGWGGTQINFKGVIDYLQLTSANFKCINLDFPPFGSSSCPESVLTIYDYAEMIFEFLTEIKIDKVNIVAHSFGGRVALILASQHGEIISKLILTDSAGLKARYSLIKKFKIFKYKVAKYLQRKNLLKIDLSKYGSADYKLLNQVMKKTFINVVNADLTDKLSLITAPTLIFWGKNDKATPLYMAKTLHKRIKNSQLVICEGGHYAYLDCFEMFVKNLIVFLG